MKHLGQYLTPGQLSGVTSDQFTFDEAGSRLLAMREALASLWPVMKAAVKAGQLSRDAMIAWNRAQSTLIGLEMKLLADLANAGIKDNYGRSLPGPDVLQRTLQVGRFAGEGLSGLGILLAAAGPLVVWGMRALNVTLIATSIYFASNAVSSFNRADIVRAETQLAALKAGKSVPPIPVDPNPRGWSGVLFGGLAVAALGLFLFLRTKS